MHAHRVLMCPENTLFFASRACDHHTVWYVFLPATKRSPFSDEPMDYTTHDVLSAASATIHTMVCQVALPVTRVLYVHYSPEGCVPELHFLKLP